MRTISIDLILGENSDKPEDSGRSTVIEAKGLTPMVPEGDRMGGLEVMPGWQIYGQDTFTAIPAVHGEPDSFSGNSDAGTAAATAAASQYYRGVRVFGATPAGFNGTVIGAIYCGEGESDTRAGEFLALSHETWGTEVRAGEQSGALLYTESIVDSDSIELATILYLRADAWYPFQDADPGNNRADYADTYDLLGEPWTQTTIESDEDSEYITFTRDPGETEDHPYLDDTDGPALFAAGVSDLTFFFWHKTPTVPGTSMRFIHGPIEVDPTASTVDSNNDPSAITYRHSGGGSTRYYQPDTGYGATDTPYTGVDSDGWMSVLINVSNTESPSIYVDNTLYTSSSPATAGWETSPTGADRFMIGAQNTPSPNAETYDGSMANVAYWRRALTSTERAALVAAGRVTYLDVVDAYLALDAYYPFFVDDNAQADEDVNNGTGGATYDLAGSPWGTAGAGLATVTDDETVNGSDGEEFCEFLNCPDGYDLETRPTISNPGTLFSTTGTDNIHIVAWIRPSDDSPRTLLGDIPVTVYTKNKNTGLELTIVNGLDEWTTSALPDPPTNGWHFISILLDASSKPVVKVNDVQLTVSGPSNGGWADSGTSAMIGNASGGLQRGFEGDIALFAVKRGTIEDATLTSMNTARHRMIPF